MLVSTGRAAVRWTGRHREVTFAVLFLAIFAVFHLGYEAARGGAVTRVLIEELTVKPGVAAINLLTPREEVVAKAHRLVSSSARLSVLNGCEGTETMLLLIAAILAFAAPWRAKAIGLLLGIPWVYALNQVRIVALYYSFRFDKELFYSLHGYVAPLLVVVLAGLYFLWWIARVNTSPHASASAP